MKEFYGGISFAGTASFSVKAENEEKGTDMVFEDIQGIELTLKYGSKVEISEINWDLISEASRGNVAIANVGDFWIEEE
ncbi:Uncharacterised protein [Clostridium tetani]|uniref:hypothetical protein n=1 Tax=Clostridium tetani TaxID=1513 RepID=UPI000D21B1D7|nr:hypothetical protein [Clostridium tetani]AVP54508.1 hypothetical protein C3B72_04960 [Clostridium tetani]RXI75225.1 hypothetical protein DP128_11745 [Clostridium tetani]WFN62903.1 hypothetical protein PAA20_05500 [Clostridium tetani]SUY55110.1 Uncharacterised protein [Clostridium tetani]BDR83507.1 hypothetical protein K254310026_09180 [Clostridium tetani]